MHRTKTFFLALSLLLTASFLGPTGACAEGAAAEENRVVKSVDRCTESYVLCTESCKNQYDSCLARAGSNAGHCSSFYTQCQSGCRRALNGCIGTYSGAGDASVAGKTLAREPLAAPEGKKGIILYNDGTWEYATAGSIDARKAGTVRPAGYDVDADGTWKNEGCPRLCARKIRYCTEWLPDGKCKLWDYRTEWYCCAP